MKLLVLCFCLLLTGCVTPSRVEVRYRFTAEECADACDQVPGGDYRPQWSGIGSCACVLTGRP